MDRDGDRLTLAATNGLDPGHVGKVSLAYGEGITGTAAKTRRPIQVLDVREDPRFKWVRGYDLQGITSMLSVPLTWNDARRRRDQRPDTGLAAIHAGRDGAARHDRGAARRDRREGAAAGGTRGTAGDADRAGRRAGRAAHASSPTSCARRSPSSAPTSTCSATPPRASAIRHPARRPRAGATRPSSRSRDSTDSSIRSWSLSAARAWSHRTPQPFDAVAAVAETLSSLGPLLRSHPLRFEQSPTPLWAVGDEARFRQVLEHLLENESKYAPPGQGVSLGAWLANGEVLVYVTDDGPGHSARATGNRCSRRSCGSIGARPRGSGHRAVRGAAPDGGDGRPGLAGGERLRRLAGSCWRCRGRRRRAGPWSAASDEAARSRCGSSSWTTSRRWSGPISALVGSAGHQVVTAYDGETALRRWPTRHPTSCCSTSRCRARDGVDGRREVRRRPATCRSSMPDRARPTSWPRSRRSTRAPTTTSRSPSGGRSCWHGSAPCCGAAEDRPRAGSPASAPSGR